LTDDKDHVGGDKMKVKNGFIMRSLAGESIVIAVGEAEKDFGSVLKLNEAGIFLWKLMQKDSNIEILTTALQNEYDVVHEVAIADVERFIEKLKSINCIDD
jgi:hypothetical protein